MLSKNTEKQILLLPIYKEKEKIISLLKSVKSKIIIIMGETGSGKTTQVPKIIYKNLDLNNKMICITQPRRVAAISISMRVSEELNSPIGNLVGYSVRFKEKISNNTKIKFVTDGMLVRECIIDKYLSKYSYIILDEIHERSIHSDILLSICKDLILNNKRNDLKLIIMSATLNPNKFLNYFNIDNSNLVIVKGRTFPVQVYNLIKEPGKNIINNYIDMCLSCIMQILISDDKEYKKGDILVFLPGQEDIEDLQELLNSRKEILKNKYPEKNIFFKVLPLYSSMPYNEQMKIFIPIHPIDGKITRKIILSTNIAETSLTIKNIKFIIDCGFFKMRKYIHKLNIDTLQINQISKNSAIQRTGRAGRESEGKCFRLYSEETYNKFNEFTEPEILRINLRNVIIQLLSIGFQNIESIDFLDKPPKENYQSAYEDLINLKAVLRNDYSLTSLGKKMSILPVEPIYSIILINSLNKEFDSVFNDIVSIVSLLQSDNILYTPSLQKEKIDKIREKFINPISDHLTLLNIFYQYKESSNKGIFCREHYLNDKALSKANDIYLQLLKYLKKIKLDELSEDKEKIEKERMDKINSFLDLIEKNKNIEDTNSIKEQLIIKCLLTGYKQNIARYSNDNIYTSIRGNMMCRLHPSSILIKKPRLAKEMKYVIYNEMIITSKKYLKCCTLVKEDLIDRNLIKNYD